MKVKNKVFMLCFLILLNACSFKISEKNYLYYQVETKFYKNDSIDSLNKHISEIENKKNNKTYSINISQFERGIQLVDSYYFELYKDLLIDIYKGNNIEMVAGMEGNVSEVKKGKFKLYKFSYIAVSANDLLYVCDNKNGCYMNVSYLINQKSEVPTKIKFEYYDSDSLKYVYDIKLIKRK